MLAILRKVPSFLLQLCKKVSWHRNCLPCCGTCETIEAEGEASDVMSQREAKVPYFCAWQAPCMAQSGTGSKAAKLGDCRGLFLAV